MKLVTLTCNDTATAANARIADVANPKPTACRNTVIPGPSAEPRYGDLCVQLPVRVVLADQGRPSPIGDVGNGRARLAAECVLQLVGRNRVDGRDRAVAVVVQDVECPEHVVVFVEVDVA